MFNNKENIPPNIDSTLLKLQKDLKDYKELVSFLNQRIDEHQDTEEKLTKERDNLKDQVRYWKSVVTDKRKREPSTPNRKNKKRKLYSSLSKTQQNHAHSQQKELVGQLCKTNPQKEAEYDELLIDGMARGTNAEVLFRVGNLMNRENMKTALVNQAKRDEKLKKRSLKKKSEQFTARKLVGVSIQKTNRLLSAFHSSVSCAGVEIGNETPKATKYTRSKNLWKK